MPVQRERSAYLDNAKALLITLVVFTHLFSMLMAATQPGKSIYHVILMFHMPAFIFVTGMLAKPNAFSKQGARSLQRLMWVYLLFQTVNYLWGYLFFGARFVPIRVLTAPVFALWFLLAMFWWRLSLPVFALGKGKVAALMSLGVAIAISVMSGYVLPDFGWMAIGRTLSFLPFYVAGYRMTQLKWSIPRNPVTLVAAAGIFAAVWALVYGSRPFVRSAMLYGQTSYHDMGFSRFEGGIARLALLLVGILLVAAFMRLAPAGRSWITGLGPVTVSIYVWHALVVRNIKFFDLTTVFAGSALAVVATTAVLVALFGFGPIPKMTLWIADAPWRLARRREPAEAKSGDVASEQRQ